MQISIKGYITSKKTELFYDCADRYAYNKSHCRFAISDGVSKSFFPKIWADVLVNRWVESKEFDEDQFISDCQEDWLKQVTEIVNKPEAKWFTKNAFNRKESGLATFVGLRFYKKKEEWFWKAEALGDSFLFFVPDKIKDFSKESIVLSSKQEPIVFDNFPDYLSSYGSNHKGEKQQKEKPLTIGTFYLMTDALAEWFLNEKDNAINKIDVWLNQKDFERFVDEERLNKKLGDDDAAILIIKLEEDNKVPLTYVEDVSNIDELIKIQQKEIEDSKQAKEQESNLEKEHSSFELEKEKTLKEKEPSTQGEENNSEIQKPQDSEKSENQKSESKSNEMSKSNTKAPYKSSRSITDKF